MNAMLIIMSYIRRLRREEYNWYVTECGHTLSYIECIYRCGYCNRFVRPLKCNDEDFIKVRMFVGYCNKDVLLLKLLKIVHFIDSVIISYYKFWKAKFKVTAYYYGGHRIIRYGRCVYFVL